MKVKIRKRSPKCIFANSNDIAELYNELILYCENDDTIKYKYDRRRKCFRNIKTKYGFSFESNLKTLQYGDVKQNVFYFNSKKGVMNWLKHLRNAFAHNRIFVDDNNNVIIQDAKKNKGVMELKMYAKVDSTAILLCIIKDVKNTQIKIKNYETI